MSRKRGEAQSQYKWWSVTATDNERGGSERSTSSFHAGEVLLLFYGSDSFQMAFCSSTFLMERGSWSMLVPRRREGSASIRPADKMTKLCQVHLFVNVCMRSTRWQTAFISVQSGGQTQVSDTRRGRRVGVPSMRRLVRMKAETQWDLFIKVSNVISVCVHQ